MTEIRFYHLQRQPLEAVLPKMLAITLERGQRAVVQAASEERLAALDDHLWTYEDDSFLPHAVDGPGAADEPVLLTLSEANPNGAQVRFLVDGAALPGEAAAYDRIIVIFDGTDEDALAVARALRAPVRHVLDEADHAEGVDLRLAGGERMHEADDAGRARHVALHVLHAAAGLDGDAAGIEHHALADEGDRGLAGLAAVPAHDHDPALPGRALADREEGAHANLAQCLLVQDLDLDPHLGEGLGAARELLRPEDVRRLVDEVAGEVHAGGEPLPGLGGLAGGRRIRHREGEPGVLVVRAVLLLLLLLSLVAVELVGPQPRAEGDVGDRLRRERGARGVDEERGGAPADLPRQEAADEPPIGLPPVLLGAEAEHDEPVEGEPGRRRDRDRRLGLALEALDRGRPGDEVGPLPAQRLRGLWSEREVVAHQHGDVAALHGSQRLEIDLDAGHGVSPGWMGSVT